MDANLGAARAFAAWATAAVATALAVWFVVSAAPNAHGIAAATGIALVPTSALLAAVLGLVVVSRAAAAPTGRRLGWLLLVAAVAAGAGAWAGGAAAEVVGSPVLRWLGTWTPAVALAALGVVVASFPNGGFTGKREVLALVPLLVGSAMAVVGAAVRPELHATLAFGAATSRNPAGHAGFDAAGRVLGEAGGALVGLGVLGALASLALGFRAASGLARGQMGWVLFAAAAATALAATALAAGGSGWEVAAGAAVGVGVPAGIAVAVVRYRAFGIYRFLGFRADYRIWTAVNVLVAAASALAVTMIAVEALAIAARPAIVTLLALAAGAATLPLWRRRQATLDRRFGQHGADPAERLEHFTAAIRDDDRQNLRGPVFDLVGGFAQAVVIEGEGGMRFALPTADQEIGRHTFVHGSYDMTPMQRAIESLAVHLGSGGPLRGRAVVDVGANVGTSLVPLLVLFGAARAVAVEPEPRNLELLQWAIALNGLEERVTVVAAAASDRAGILPLGLADRNWGDHRLRQHEDGPAGEAARATIDVPVVRLDDAVAEAGVRSVDVGLVWMDVQGHEGHVLAGAPELVAAGVPVVTELWPSGLMRSGGLDLLLEIACEGYQTFVDLRGEERGERAVAELPRLVAALEGTERFTDVLLLS